MSHAQPSENNRRDPAEAAKQVADLQAVLEVSRNLSATVELTPLLLEVEQAALKVLECERATVFLFDRENNELFSRMATGVDEIRFSADRGISGEVVRTGQVINVPDAYADPRFNPEIDRKTGFKTRNMITFPLIGFDDSIVGVLQVLNKTTGTFDVWDNELVTTFGAQVGVAVQRQLLLEHFAEKQRIEHDLDIAREIQQELLPTQAAQVKGFDIAGWNKAADQTGGDCFDYCTLPDGTLAMTLADATGHGIAAALVIAQCRAMFRAIISVTQDLPEMVGQVNNLLHDDLPANRFVTAFFGLLSPTDNTLTFLSAGHGPLLQYIKATDEVIELNAGGLPLGIMPDAPYETQGQFKMLPGDMMVLITDGFFEWATTEGEQYGMERLNAVIRETQHLDSEKIIETLYKSVLSFAKGSPQDDDLTALIIKKL